MRKRGKSELYQRGLTLVELMVALAIAFIVIAAVYQAFTSQQRTYTIQDQVAEAQQNARVAMNILMRDLRMAGHGKPEGIVVIRGVEYNYSIGVEGGLGPEGDERDVIKLVGCFGSPKGYLTRTADEGETQIWVRSTGNELSEIFENSKYIFIGGMDKLMVIDAPGDVYGTLILNGPLVKRYPTGVLSGSVESDATQIPLRITDGLKAGDILFLGEDRLIVRDVGTDTITIDTDPDMAGNQGISKSYPDGTYVNLIPIYRLTALEYSIEDDDRDIPYLSRNDKVEGDSDLKLAENIQALEVNQEDQHLYRITLTARTRVKDPDYGFRTRTLESQVRLRNL